MKTVEDSRTEQVRLLRYPHLNGQRRLFGGVLMQWIDELATIVAQRHSESEVITAAVDNLQFKHPAYLNDLLLLNGRVTYIGNTSMEVCVETYIQKRNASRELINRAYLVMVATDASAKPIQIPPIDIRTEKEKQDWERGQKRYELRKTRRKEKF